MLLGLNYLKDPVLLCIELAAKPIIFNVMVFMAHSDSSSGFSNLDQRCRSSSCLLWKVNTGIKLTKCPAMEFLLISSMTDKKTFVSVTAGRSTVHVS